MKLVTLLKQWKFLRKPTLLMMMAGWHSGAIKLPFKPGTIVLVLFCTMYQLTRCTAEYKKIVMMMTMTKKKNQWKIE